MTIPVGHFGTVFPDSDSQSAPLGPELLFQICHIFPGKLTRENVYRNCGTFPGMNLHLDSNSSGNMMLKMAI